MRPGRLIETGHEISLVTGNYEVYLLAIVTLNAICVRRFTARVLMGDRAPNL